MLFVLTARGVAKALNKDDSIVCIGNLEMIEMKRRKRRPLKKKLFL
jgi:hypothetical protein